MSARIPYRAALRRLSRFGAEEAGTTLVELAIAIPLFLLIFLGLMDFGLFASTDVMAQKAVERATRLAVVRPPACAGVATVNARGTVNPGDVPPPFGTSCSAGANVCTAPATVSCAGSTGNATVAEIWALVQPAMPYGTTAANLQFSYSYDARLGFLGGPYVPLVTVKLQNATYNFISPLGALATLAGAGGTGPAASVTLPPLSLTLPGEDLAMGGG